MNSYRDYIYLGIEGGYARLALVTPGAPGTPLKAVITNVGLAYRDEGYNGGESASAVEALRYWQLREAWAPADVAALYAKWYPKRDAVLAKEEYLGKSKREWERFYTALADECASREYAAGIFTSAVKEVFGAEELHGAAKERVQKFMEGGRAG